MKNTIGVVTSTYPNYSAMEAMEGISKAGFRYIELISEILSNVVDEKLHILQQFTMQPPPLLTLHQQISYSPIHVK